MNTPFISDCYILACAAIMYSQCARKPFFSFCWLSGHKPLKLIVTSMIVMRRRLQLSISVIAALSFVLFLAQSGLSINASFAQTPNATNQTTAKTTGQPETTVLNKTTNND